MSAFLLGWIAALLLVALINVSQVLFLVPRIMRLKFCTTEGEQLWISCRLP